MAPFFVFSAVVLPVEGQDASSSETPGSSANSGAASDPLIPVPIAAGPGSPRILRLPHGGSPIVALRLFVPLDEAASEAGGGWIIARLAELRIAEASRRLGAAVSVRRTPEGISYAVAGPRTDFDYLAYILRLAAAEPDASLVTDVRRELEGALDGLLETGPGQVELELRLRTGTGPPVAGTPGSIPRLSAAAVLGLWSRTHRPERATLLVSGGVERPLLLASLTEIGALDGVAPVRPGGPPPTEPPAPDLQLIRRFTGRAWSGLRATDPAAPVLARLAAEALRTAPGDFEARVLLWDAGSGPVLAATGVAFPARFEALAGALDGLLSAAAELARGDAFTRAVAEVRREWLLGLDDPLGRLQIVGSAIEGDDGLDAARRRMDALDALTPARVLEAIDGLRGTAARVTVR